MASQGWKFSSYHKGLCVRSKVGHRRGRFSSYGPSYTVGTELHPLPRPPSLVRTIRTLPLELRLNPRVAAWRKFSSYGPPYMVGTQLRKFSSYHKDPSVGTQLGGPSHA